MKRFWLKSAQSACVHPNDLKLTLLPPIQSVIQNHHFHHIKKESFGYVNFSAGFTFYANLDPPHFRPVKTINSLRARIRYIPRCDPVKPKLFLMLH